MVIEVKRCRAIGGAFPSRGWSAGGDEPVPEFADALDAADELAAGGERALRDAADETTCQVGGAHGETPDSVRRTGATRPADGAAQTRGVMWSSRPSSALPY